MFPITGSVGHGGINRPKDVQALKQKLSVLGFPDILDHRGEDALTGDGPDRNQGFFNREVAIETNDPHDFGTSWLAEVISSAGRHYVDDYLKVAANRLSAPLIAVNDASRDRGVGTADHEGHETGLMVDIVLPRTDGTARRNPDISWKTNKGKLNPEYNRAAMEAVLGAFWKAKPNSAGDSNPIAVSKAFFNDAELANKPAPGVEEKMLCRRLKGHDGHAHISVRPPERKAAATPILSITKPVGEGPAAFTDPAHAEGGADVRVVSARLAALGFTWAEEGANTEEQQQNLIQAIRLFQAITRGHSVVAGEGVDGRVDPGGFTEKWLNADNAPRWQQLPVGTVEIDHAFVRAIRIFQGIKNYSFSIKGTDGKVDPHDSTHEWLGINDDKAWWGVLAAEGDGYQIVPFPGDVPRSSDLGVSSWLKSLIRLAGQKYANGDATKKVEIRHPAAAFPELRLAQTGLRIQVALKPSDPNKPATLDPAIGVNYDRVEMKKVVEAFHAALAELSTGNDKLAFADDFDPASTASRAKLLLLNDPELKDEANVALCTPTNLGTHNTLLEVRVPRLRIEPPQQKRKNIHLKKPKQDLDGEPPAAKPAEPGVGLILDVEDPDRDGGVAFVRARAAADP